MKLSTFVLSRLSRCLFFWMALQSAGACSQAPKKTAASSKGKIVYVVKTVNGKRVRVARRVVATSTTRAPASVAATSSTTSPASSQPSDLAALSASSPASSSSYVASSAPGRASTSSTETARAPAFAAREMDSSAVLTEIAFGSWANQNYPQPLWTAVQESKPNLFVFLGDTMKLDGGSFSEQYAKLDANENYRSLRESVPFLAVWNTQDYNVDVGQKEFSQYWSYLKNDLKPSQTGVYHSETIGPKGKQVQFLMLDTRSHRGPRLAGDKPNAPVLGEEQWKWIEEKLSEPSDVKFIVSSIPLIPARQDGESWNNYPVERQRLFDLIKKIRPRNLAVISGGARQGSVATTGLKGWGALYDVTTGPMNDPSDGPAQPDERIVGPTTITENFAVAQIDWAHRLLVIKLLDAKRTIVNSASIKLH